MLKPAAAGGSCNMGRSLLAAARGTGAAATASAPRAAAGSMRDRHAACPQTSSSSTCLARRRKRVAGVGAAQANGDDDGDFKISVDETIQKNSSVPASDEMAQYYMLCKDPSYIAQGTVEVAVSGGGTKSVFSLLKWVAAIESVCPADALCLRSHLCALITSTSGERTFSASGRRGVS